MKLFESFKIKFPMLPRLCILLFLAASNLFAQKLENLKYLEDTQTKTYYSDGFQEQAKTMANHCDNVLLFYKSVINFEPNVTLLLLSKADWNKYTNFPVYGMPHYIDGQTLIVAAEDNDFWKSFIPPLNQLPPKLAKQISTTYSDKNNSLTMRGFFDLLAIHELGHVFQSQGGLTMQRKWMAELFADLFLHTYIAEMEPELLQSLTVFPKMVVASINKVTLKYTTLNELESNYAIIVGQFPNNYGWFQSKWHIAAKNIYDEGGIAAFKNLWKELKSRKELLNDANLAEMLASNVHQSVADVQLKWDE